MVSDIRLQAAGVRRQRHAQNRFAATPFGLRDVDGLRARVVQSMRLTDREVRAALFDLDLYLADLDPVRVGGCIGDGQIDLALEFAGFE